MPRRGGKAMPAQAVKGARLYFISWRLQVWFFIILKTTVGRTGVGCDALHVALLRPLTSYLTEFSQVCFKQ
jgi:hypothetical protein